MVGDLSRNRQVFIMLVSVDDTNPFGTYRPGICLRTLYSTMEVHQHGWWGRRVYDLLRWVEWLFPSVYDEPIVDIERFGLRWRLYPKGNYTDKCLLSCFHKLEQIEISWIFERVKPGFILVDIGANCGFYTQRVAHALAGMGRVVAVEPHPEMLRRLRFNVELNFDSSVQILGCAVGDHSETTKLSLEGKNLGRTKVSSQGFIDVKMKTLLGILETEEIDRIDALKVDVEGFEDHVLEPFFAQAPDSILPELLIAEYAHSDHWKVDWLKLAMARGYRDQMHTPKGNIILTRE